MKKMYIIAALLAPVSSCLRGMDQNDPNNNNVTTADTSSTTMSILASATPTTTTTGVTTTSALSTTTATTTTSTTTITSTATKKSRITTAEAKERYKLNALIDRPERARTSLLGSYVSKQELAAVLRQQQLEQQKKSAGEVFQDKFIGGAAEKLAHVFVEVTVKSVALGAEKVFGKDFFKSAIEKEANDLELAQRKAQNALTNAQIRHQALEDKRLQRIMDTEEITNRSTRYEKASGLLKVIRSDNKTHAENKGKGQSEEQYKKEQMRYQEDEDVVKELCHEERRLLIESIKNLHKEERAERKAAERSEGAERLQDNRPVHDAGTPLQARAEQQRMEPAVGS